MKKTQGFTLVEIMIVVAIIGILAAIAVPNFVKNRNDSQRRTCISNMRQIKTAVENWKADLDVTDAFSNEAIFGSDKYIQVEPKCPTAKQTYSISGTASDAVVTVTCGANSSLNHQLTN